MLSLLRSSAPLALTLTTLALGSTGCAAKLGGSARFSTSSPSIALSVPSPRVSVHGYGSASSSTDSQAQINAQAKASAQAQAQANAQAQASAPTQVQYGGSTGGSAGGGFREAADLPPAARPQPWRPAPAFYGVPLENAQDVVFVLDRSGSMTEADAGAPMGFASPVMTLSALTTMGSRALAGFSLPTSSPPLGASTSAFVGWSGLVPCALTARQTKLDIAKAELTSAIAGLPDGTRYNVIFFGDTVSSLSPSLVTLNVMTRVGSLMFVQSICPDGSTAAVPALRSAYASHPRRIVFLSDGLANVGGDGQQLYAEAREQMRAGVRFDTVGVGADQDRPLMRALAAESGGISTSR